MDLLRPGLACASLDLPGFGDSPPRPDGRYSIGALAQTVIALIETQKRGPVHLIGNSLGGAVSVRVAATRPELIRTLTLISPALPDSRPRPDLLRFPIIGLPWLGTALFRQLRRIPPERRVADVIATCYRDPGLFAQARFAAEVAELTRRDSLDHAGAALAGSARALTAEVLRGGGRPGGTRPGSPRRPWSSTAATTAWSIRGTRATPRTPSATPRSWCCRTPATSRRWSVPASWRPKSVCSSRRLAPPPARAPRLSGAGNSRSLPPVDRGTDGGGNTRPVRSKISTPSGEHRVVAAAGRTRRRADGR